MKIKKTRRNSPAAARTEEQVLPQVTEEFPMAQAVLDSAYRIIQSNGEFQKLLRLDKAHSRSFPELFGERDESVRKYLSLSNEAGLSLEYTGPDQNTQHFRILARKVNKAGQDQFCVVIQDFTNFQESVAYFEQSFDQFMEGTIHLEDALKTIERQKDEIETINHELKQTNVIMRKDLELAEILQNDLLPAVPAVDGWSLSTYFQPMAGVSGDIIDFYDFPGADSLGVILLDASGHGVSSALITAIARPVFFRAQRRYMNKDLGEAVSSANRMLCDQIGHIYNYLSGVSVRLYKDRIVYINAGHPYILIYRRRLDKVFRLPNSAMLLGIDAFRDRVLTAREIKIEPGDILLLYTDGLTEAKSPDGDEYGLDRLKSVIKDAAADPGAPEIRDRILADFRSFAATPDRLKDDMTLIALMRDQ